MKTYNLLVLSLCVMECVCQESARIVYENAGVESGRSVYSICLVTQVNSSRSFSGFKPVLGDAGGKIGYISLYSCHGSSAAEYENVKNKPLDCESWELTSVREKCGERLMFMWSRAMGPDYQEDLPGGIGSGSSGLVLLVVSYINTMLSYQDSSGMELKYSPGDVEVGDQMGRLIIAHEMPRMIVMGGVETWKSFVVCHRSCLRKMEDDDIHIKRVTIFTGSRGTRGRIGVLVNNATDIHTDIIDQKIIIKDEYGFAEGNIDRKISSKGTDLWLECDYNTIGEGVSNTILGGLGGDSEHCLAVVTYTSKTSVTSCKSQPSEYSVLYALDMYLAAQDYTEYVSDYYDDVDVFDSYDYNIEEYSFSYGSRKRRSLTRGRRQAHVPSVDLFMDKISDDNRKVKI